MNNLLRQIPKVDDILKDGEWQALLSWCPEGIAKEELRAALEEIRQGIKAGREKAIPASSQIVSAVRRRVTALLKPGLRRVINGTGVIIHTNLGRSLLAESAIAAMSQAARCYTNLEYDIEKGVRGDRYEHCTSLIRRLTGAESALVANNNAAAVFLTLNTFAEGKEVLISRGELVEIGGSFRIPDVMKKSGALLREVGTTNRTYLSDYEDALSDRTGMIMKVHTSNYRIRGFVHEASVEDLAGLGRKVGLPTFYDAGSGLLFPLGEDGRFDEPPIRNELSKGIDIISFSGDKLLGAPQAGIIAGKKSYVDAMKQNPITRAFRPDKFTLAALEATLLIYLDEDAPARMIPTLKMIYAEPSELRQRARRLALRLRRRRSDISIAVVDLYSEVGGGALPDIVIPSSGIAIMPESMSVESLERRLRGLDVPIIGRIEKDNLFLDMRTILKTDEGPLLSGLLTALNAEGV